jgi:hypothetical protein
VQRLYLKKKSNAKILLNNVRKLEVQDFCMEKRKGIARGEMPDYRDKSKGGGDSTGQP